jgi:hypothetical protein
VSKKQIDLFDNFDADAQNLKEKEINEIAALAKKLLKYQHEYYV